MKDTDNIKIFINNNSYKETLENIKGSDYIIHLGDHEGLGLGFSYKIGTL